MTNSELAAAMKVLAPGSRRATVVRAADGSYIKVGDYVIGDETVTPLGAYVLPSLESLEAEVARQQNKIRPIKARQLRLGLLSIGLTPAVVEAQIAAIPDAAARAAAAIEWEFNDTYRREHPLVAQLGAAMGFNPQQIDDYFIAWSRL